MDWLGAAGDSVLSLFREPPPPIPAREQPRGGKFLDKSKAAAAPAHAIPAEIDVFAPGQGPLTRTKESKDTGNGILVVGGFVKGLLDDYPKMTAEEAMKIRGEAAYGMGEGVGLAFKDTIVGLYTFATNPVGTVVNGVTGLVHAFTHPTESNRPADTGGGGAVGRGDSAGGGDYVGSQR